MLNGERMEMLVEIITELKKNKDVCHYDEARIRQGVVLQILGSLGWNTWNVHEVVPEYSVGGRRVDFALRCNGKIMVFIEVKKGSEDLNRHERQLLEYSFGQGVPIALLTNGVEWWFYLPLAEGIWEHRKFCRVNIHEDDVELVVNQFCQFLSKESVASGKAKEYAKEIYETKLQKKIVEENLPKAWEGLLAEPDELLVELLAEATERICGFKPKEEIVRKFLKDAARRRSSERAFGESGRVFHERERRVRPRTSDMSQQGRSIELRARSRYPDSNAVRFWLTPVREHLGESPESILRRLLGKGGIYAFGDGTPGRKKVKPGDFICFYAAGKGIVAHAKIASYPEYSPDNPKVKEAQKFPWVFKVEDVHFYFENPVVLTEELREKLDAFVNKDPHRNWGWLVQTTREITAHDFRLLTRAE